MAFFRISMIVVTFYGDMMKFTFTRALALVSTFSLVAMMTLGCDSDDDNDSSKPTGTDWSMTTKKSSAEYLNSVGKLDAYFTQDAFQNATTEEQKIGATCYCYGPQCNYAGYERPELQTEMVSRNDGEYQAAKIYGCDGVDESYHGAIRSCFRSSDVANIEPAIYFPLGTCGLTMSYCIPGDVCDPEYDCIGQKQADGTYPENCCTSETAIEKNNDTICGFARFGTYTGTTQAEYDTAAADFKEAGCPDGQVMLDFEINIKLTTLARYAKLLVRGCFQGCEQDSDCAGYNITDPITQEASQLKCIQTDPDANGKKANVCFDRRTVAKADNPEQALIFVDTTESTSPVDSKYLVQ